MSRGSFDLSNSDFTSIFVCTTPGCTEHMNMSGCSCARYSMSFPCATFDEK